MTARAAAVEPVRRVGDDQVDAAFYQAGEQLARVSLEELHEPALFRAAALAVGGSSASARAIERRSPSRFGNERLTAAWIRTARSMLAARAPPEPGSGIHRSIESSGQAFYAVAYRCRTRHRGHGSPRRYGRDTMTAALDVRDRDSLRRGRARWFAAAVLTGVLLVGSPSRADARKVSSESLAAHIIGGSPAAAGTWPSMAFVAYVDPDGAFEFTCSGTVVAVNVVLTAGHCGASESTGVAYDPSSYAVSTGSLDCGRPMIRQVSGVSRVIVYPGFVSFDSGEFADGDASLLQLSTPTTAPAMPLASDPDDASSYWRDRRRDRGMGAHRAWRCDPCAAPVGR